MCSTEKLKFHKYFYECCVVPTGQWGFHSQVRLKHVKGSRKRLGGGLFTHLSKCFQQDFSVPWKARVRDHAWHWGRHIPAPNTRCPIFVLTLCCQNVCLYVFSCYQIIIKQSKILQKQNDRTNWFSCFINVIFFVQIISLKTTTTTTKMCLDKLS